MKHIFPRHKIEIVNNKQVTYIEKSILFGAVKWWEKISCKTVGNDLVIETDPQISINKVYINGILVEPIPPSTKEE